MDSITNNVNYAHAEGDAVPEAYDPTTATYTFTDESKKERLGWVCSRCRKAHGPHVDHCDCEDEEKQCDGLYWSYIPLTLCPQPWVAPVYPQPWVTPISTWPHPRYSPNLWIVGNDPWAHYTTGGTTCNED